MNLVSKSYQCMKGFTSEDACIVLIMIIPKLLLLLPLVLLAEAQNDSQRGWSNRVPLRRPVITPGFRPESTLSPITNTPITSKQIPEYVTQEYFATSTITNEELTTKSAEIPSVPSITSETQAPNRGKVGFTIIFSNSYTENPIIDSSTPSPSPTTTQRFNQRPSWFRPISRPENNQPSSSTAGSSPLIVPTSTLAVSQSSSTVIPSIKTAAPTAAAVTIISSEAPPTSTVAPPTLTIENVEVATNKPSGNQEQGGGKPGFTIIFSDNYTKKPMTINPSEDSLQPSSQDSEDGRPGYTIIFSDNYKKLPTTVNSFPVSVPSTSTVAPSIITIENVEVATEISPANQESGDKKPGFTDTSTKKPATIDYFSPTSTVNQNIVYIPTQTTNLPPKKPTESYSIIIIKNNNSDSNVNSQQTADLPKKPGDTTTAPLTTTVPVITLTSQQSVETTEVEPVTNKFPTPRPSSVRPFPSRPIPTRKTTPNPTTSAPPIVTVVSKAPAPVTNTPVTTPAWRTTTTAFTTSTTTMKPPTTWTTSTTTIQPPTTWTTSTTTIKPPTTWTTSTTTMKPPTTWTTSTTTRKPPTTWKASTLNPQTTWKPTTQSVGQQRPPQANVINELHDYICRDVNGYYSLENKCDEYILCKNNTAYKNTCPDGLHFNTVARYPAYPCGYPTEVKCQNPSIKQPAQPTGECPHRFGHFPVPNGDCGHFMMCQEGVATIMACPPGLAFNGKISACDWSINVPGCNPSAFEGFTCPAVKSDIYGNSAIINYGYKNSCKNYIACHEGHPRLLSCDAGLSFDEATAKCVESSLVNNCKS